MNKTIYPSGHQIEVDATLLEFDTESLTDAINSILSGLVDPTNTIYIISGCKLTGTNDPILSSGAIFYNNELFIVDGTTFTGKSSSDINNYYFDLQESWQPDGARISYTDGSTKETKKVRKAVLKPVSSNFSGIPQFVNVVNIRTDITTLQNSTLSKGTTFLPSQVVKTDPNSKLITEVEKTAFNKDFDSNGVSTLIARADHVHTNTTRNYWTGYTTNNAGSSTKISGEINVTVTKVGTGQYEVTHSLGTTNYVAFVSPTFAGSAGSRYTYMAGLYNIDANKFRISFNDFEGGDYTDPNPQDSTFQLTIIG